jgi:hypothetical protein
MENADDFSDSLVLDILRFPKPKLLKTIYGCFSNQDAPSNQFPMEIVAGFAAASESIPEERPPRGPLVKKERLSVKLKILNMTAALFKRNYRLAKQDFMNLLSKVRPLLEYNNPIVNHKCGEDCDLHVDPLIQLAVTLRMLAGGSYLDICFGYHISTGSFYTIFWRVLKAIDRVLDNIRFDWENEEAMEDLEASFLKISKGAFRGTVAAGDGIIFRRTKPAAADVDGNVRSFFTRKGFWGHALQAFCDGNCKFLHISQRVCASTHDGTAYVLTGIAEIIRQGKLNPRWHIVLDEAYKCSEQELSPWKGKQLSPEKDVFNYYLSLHRQVIERAFGILVARWGIFWRPLKFHQVEVELIVQVCCKLHNICVDAFGITKQSVDISFYDKHWVRGHDEGADATVLYTDGTGKRQGERSDLLVTRQKITLQLAAMGLSRPTHSKTRAMLTRIQDAMPNKSN